MITKSISKSTLTALLLSIVFNYIIIEGIGNVYLSTLIIFGLFLFILAKTQGGLILKSASILGMAFFTYSFITTLLNVFFFAPEILKQQIVTTVIYLQNTLVFLMAVYFFERISIDYFLKLFTGIVFLVTIRVIIEEPDHILQFSVEAGKRIEAYFVGGVNNFALLIGIALIVVFFHFKRRFLRIALMVYFLLAIALTMSRGALLSVIVCILLTSMISLDKRTINNIFKYSAVITFLVAVFIMVTGKSQVIWNLICERFFGLFTNNESLDIFFSGRGSLIKAIFGEMSNSSILQIIFGHGNGSIDFYDEATLQHYETSHNFLIDILFRNGIILLLTYLLAIFYLGWVCYKSQNKYKLTIFGLFIFIHLELLVNPIFFAAQTGWIYALLLMLFIKQMKKNEEESNIQIPIEL